MQRRNTQQRRRDILEQLHQTGEVTVDALANKHETSEVTIRKDLASLENDGLVLRRHGGAILMPTDASELNSEKVSKRKKIIASTAATLINDHDRIIVDSGSTTAALLEFLKDKRGLVIMTNSLQVATELLDQEQEPTILMTGGTWDTQSSSFQGKMAEQILRSYNFDIAFLGAAGLDAERGSTTFNELTQLSNVMAEVSRKVVVMSESVKFGRKMPNLELPWEKITTLVTDSDIGETDQRHLESKSVEVLIAKA